MKKNNVIGIILVLTLFALIVWFIFGFNNTDKVADIDYNSTRTSLNQISENDSTNTGANDLSEPTNNSLNESNTTNESSDNTTNESEVDSNNNSAEENDNNTTSENAEDSKNNASEENLNQTTDENTNKTVPATKETEISTFTTKIYTKDSGRQNNLTLACSALNDTIVKNGNTFSFSSTVGKASSKKGYKKADVFKNGDVIEALGGGLCQVSTTLYNAVLKVPNTKVTERHPHSNKVPYIKPGKDAAVSYGTYDFKFVNNTGNSLKIKASNTKNNVTVRIMKIE